MCLTAAKTPDETALVANSLGCSGRALVAEIFSGEVLSSRLWK